MNLQKPLSVAKRDFEEELRKLINDSQLPVFVLEPILEAYYRQVKEVSQNLERDERRKYEIECYKALKKEEEKAGEADGKT